MSNTDLKVQVRFEATGDKELAKAFTTAANAQKKLEEATKKLNKEQKKSKKWTDRLTTGFTRLTKSSGKLRFSLATVRSQLLVWTFAVNALNKTLGAAVRKYQEQQVAIAKLNQTLRSTGFAAGISSRELKGLASRLQKLTGIGDETILSMQGILLTFTQIKGDIFKDATKAILDVSVAMGQDLKQSAIQVGKALNDPRIGVSALSRVGIQFDDTQKKMIKNFADTNQIAKAQRIILNELEIQFGSTAENLDSTSVAINRLSSSWGDFLEGGGGKLAPYFKGIANSISDVIENINETDESRMNEIFSVLSTDARNAAADSIYLADILDKKILSIMKEIGFASNDLELQELFSEENQNRVIEFGESIKDNPNKFLQETNDKIRELQKEAPDVLSELITGLSELGNVEEILGKSGALGWLGEGIDAGGVDFQGMLDMLEVPQDLKMKALRHIFTNALDDDNLTSAEIKEIENKFNDSFSNIINEMVLTPDLVALGGKSTAWDWNKGFAFLTDDINPFADILNKIFTVDGVDFSENAIALDQLQILKNAILEYMEATGIAVEQEKSPLERITDNLVEFKKESEGGRKAFDDMLAAGMAFSKGNKKVTIALLQMRQAMAIGNVLLAFTEEWKSQNYAKAFSVLATGMMKVAQFKEQISAAREAAIGADFITQGRQTLVVGDNPSGRERVQVTPLGNAGGGGATGSGVVVNINGNILGTDEFVRDTLIPRLEDSLGRNLA